MNVLLIKTSSMGDIIHTLPALTDAMQAIPGIQFDWVVEESFKEIPTWHPAVRHVYPIPLRRWLRQPLQAITSQAFKDFFKTMRRSSYYLVLDAQGLTKSALLAWMVKAPRHGLGRGSAREWLAALTYQHRYRVSWELHAVERLRLLFSKVLSYPLQDSTPHYGIDVKKLPSYAMPTHPYVIFLSGTTWATKHWPESYWQQLAVLVAQQGTHILLPWGTDAERLRAEKIAAMAPGYSTVLPKLSLSTLATLFSKAMALVSVDTGLGHLACALHRPTISIYGPTSAKLTGTLGPAQIHLSTDFTCSPCFLRECTFKTSNAVMPPCYDTVNPTRVWQSLQTLLTTTPTLISLNGGSLDGSDLVE
jgi:heptosyltransferase-1